MTPAFRTCKLMNGRGHVGLTYNICRLVLLRCLHMQCVYIVSPAEDDDDTSMAEVRAKCDGTVKYFNMKEWKAMMKNNDKKKVSTEASGATKRIRAPPTKPGDTPLHKKKKGSRGESCWLVGLVLYADVGNG